MKRILAILLALLMLGSVSAFAEAAPVFAVVEPSLLVQNSDGTNQINTPGLQILVGAMPGDEQGVVLNILGGGQLLFRAQARVEGEGVLLSADGLSHSYYLAQSAKTGNIASSVDVQALIAPIMEQVQLNYEADGIHFELPYTAVVDVLEQLAPQINTGSSDVDLEQVIASLRESQSGPTVSGVLQPTDNGTTGELAVYMVENGVKPETPAANLSFSMETNEAGAAFSGVVSVGGAAVVGVDGSFARTDDGAHFVLQASLPDGNGGFVPMGQLELSVSGKTLTAAVGIDMTGSGSFLPIASLDAQWADGFDLTLSAAGMLSLGIHAKEDFSLAMNVAGTASLNVNYRKADGALSVAGSVGGVTYQMNATVTAVDAELVLCDSEGPVLNLTDLTEEQTEALKAELQAALTPVIGYIQSVQ